ncbi:unnamed protein product [Leptidea sinapis]|uniref:Uncharacterized protein n=1 Tax=Leptidea sinapis TaxID=189913 RepID=A0A5E4QBI0_9NEOP|nr:unnamed protein product [Leptidea sinapis]
MMHKISFHCNDCFKPTMRRLANFKPKDEFECYAESYVKGFWDLCEYRKSEDSFLSKTTDKAYSTSFSTNPSAMLWELCWQVYFFIWRLRRPWDVT